MNRLTNDELKHAIAWTSQRIREVGTAERQYVVLNGHLVKLLEVQAFRASLIESVTP